jgi:hypothetical protein
LEIAGGIGIPPERLLADVMLRQPTDLVVDFDVAANALLEGLIGTHPNATRNDQGELVLRLTLDDVLHDATTIKSRFGPSGAHPGFIPQDPSTVVQSKVLLEGFAMQIPLQSNLQPYDGIDAGKEEKDIVYLLQGGSVLSFDFFSPDFSVVGLDDEPSLDLRIAISESAQFFAANTGTVWSASPWLLERIVAELARTQFQDAFAPTHQHDFIYYVYPSCPSPPCPGNEVARINWDTGWLTFTATGISVPPPQYVWDLLLEVAQIRLHDGGIPEGGGATAFTLQHVPVGLTADALIERTRPSLQAQEQQLSDALAGSSGLIAPRADIYYLRTPEGDDKLVSRGGGFFADAALATKLADTEITVALGTRLYFTDTSALVHVIEVVDRRDDGIDVTLGKP